MATRKELRMKLYSPPEEVYSVYRRMCYLFPIIMPSGIQNIKLINGRWESQGSRRCWTFADGKCGSWVDEVAAIDDNEKSIRFELRDGDNPLAHYNSLKLTFSFTPDGEGCEAKAVLEFERRDSNADPSGYMKFIGHMLGAVDVFLEGTRVYA